MLCSNSRSVARPGVKAGRGGVEEVVAAVSTDTRSLREPKNPGFSSETRLQVTDLQR